MRISVIKYPLLSGCPLGTRCSKLNLNRYLYFRYRMRPFYFIKLGQSRPNHLPKTHQIARTWTSLVAATDARVELLAESGMVQPSAGLSFFLWPCLKSILRE